MNENYIRALEGKLPSPAVGDTKDLAIGNGLAAAVRVFWLDEKGNQQPLITRKPQSPGSDPSTLNLVSPQERATFEVKAGDGLVFCLAATGSFVCFVSAKDVSTIALDATRLTAPNDIGPLPVPSKTRIIPTDSPRTVVGLGKAPNGVIISREQYWRRAAESISLAAKESRTVRYSVRSGVTQTGSNVEDANASLFANASAGWGRISASISASLNVSMSTSQSFTITDEREVSVAEVIEKQDHDVTIFHWQLMDEVYLIKNGAVTASVSMARAPVLRQTIDKVGD